MGRRRQTVCAEDGCPNVSDQPRCEQHRSKAWATSTRRSRLPADWSTRVARVRRRAKATCEQCGRAAPDGECDHIDGTDDHRLANLQWLCKEPCHAEKTKRERIAARWPGR